MDKSTMQKIIDLCSTIEKVSKARNFEAENEQQKLRKIKENHNESQ